ncbi:uncharacterized protein Z518_04532 [Rhinocladiella mackenziei CBS 650.93]|uniref:DUF6314 domain-containing protein n=1 Tax=Rhinocladiella mackenziei CBS 650.93 TaxID=1442369 RepID=A0A0D2ITS5_9EURO|nr:uncharacterized protein Z518_04532 [Rhinocladiella mackenziei CBS 650.93]KIX06556.1 hypothetical protein Z518_04532 [Rhinocladiella mackenziei CBS 650.93]
MQEPDHSSSRSILLIHLFQSLSGTWILNRKVQSADPSEPSGLCSGQATFTKTPPSPVIDADGRLHLADLELLYHEQGEFDMTIPFQGRTNPPKFSFARKYIWRLNLAENVHTISIWFTKPGTNTIDYLFHQIDISFPDDDSSNSTRHLVLTGTGGHLCVDDFYSSSYSFTMFCQDNALPALFSWTTSHEVLGPKKDQVIETTFTKPRSLSLSPPCSLHISNQLQVPP